MRRSTGGMLAAFLALGGCDARSELPGRVCPVGYDEIAASAENPGSIAIHGSRLYYTVIGQVTEMTVSTTIVEGGSVMSVPRDGGAPTTIASDQRFPLGIAVDDTGVYWVTNGDGGLHRSGLDGGGVTDLATGLGRPHAIALDGEDVYVADFYGRLVRVSKSGGDAETIGDGEMFTGGAYSVAIDADSVFVLVASGPEKRVVKVPKGGGAAEVIATSDGGEDSRFLLPLAMAIDADHVYWSTFEGWGAVGHGAVLRVAKSGGPVQTIASGTYDLQGSAQPINPLSVAVAGDRVYIAGNGLLSVPKIGGALELMLVPGSPAGPNGAVMVAGGDLYWTVGLPSTQDAADFGVFTSCR